MALKNILKKVRAEYGMNTPNLNGGQDAYLIDKINEAALNLWESKDLPITLKECCLKATADKQIALPAFVGELRAIRAASDDIIWHDARWSLKGIRSKYVETEWKRMWNNWREIGESPLCKELLNTAPGTIQISDADPDLVVTISGATETANKTSESISMTGTDMTWTKSFTDITSIRKNKVSDTDVVILDAYGSEISIIYSDQLEARFLIIDVSRYPFTGPSVCDDGSYITQLLYKPRLNRMERDEDCFPVQGYDDIIVLMTKQLLAEEEPGKEERAMLMYKKADLLLAQKINDKTAHTKKGISFGRNPLLQHRRLYQSYNTTPNSSTDRFYE